MILVTVSTFTVARIVAKTVANFGKKCGERKRVQAVDRVAGVACELGAEKRKEAKK